jgi:hypothetical protein
LSTIDSPTDDRFASSSSAVALFDPSADYSMTEDFSGFTANLTSAISPIKLYHHRAGNGDPQDIDSGMFLQNNSPFDYIGCDEYASLLSPVKFNINDSNPHYFPQYQQQQQQGHRRASSVSSAPHSGTYSPSQFGGAPQQRSFSSTPARQPLTPDQTPVQTSFLAPPFNSYEVSSRNADASGLDMAMRRAILEHQQQNQQPQHQQQNAQQSQQPQQTPHQYQPQSGTGSDSPFPYSFAPSVSTVNTSSPATPQTNYADDDLSRGVSHGEHRNPVVTVERWMDECLQFDDLDTETSGAPGITKLTRTVSDIYQDELYNPAMSAVAQSHSQSHRAPHQQHHQQQQQQHGGKAFPSYQNIINDRLQAAHQGHIAAHAQAAQDARQSSPFRQGSPYAQPASSFHSAHLQQPSQLSAELPQSGLRGMSLMNGNQAESKTISPKEALLEYHDSDEANAPPLFPAQPDSSQYNVAPPPNVGVGQNYMGMELPQYSQVQQSPQQYFFQQRALQERLRQQQQQQQQPQQQQPTAAGQHRETQRLPTHIAASTNGSSTSERQRDNVRRPEDTSSDAGTYSCTYHGCTLRFDSPARLQKHKREAHRQTTPSTHGLLRDSSTGPMRNSQAGPHKCERINPSTGKPCNSIFSRPYDLTRHEDTIHNARKQKVRCHLCTEEKTFSRNDALTRHMRVVHPEVSWPGKQKRKGRD